MNVLVIGSGGREHALLRSLSQSKGIGSLYAIPGNAGMEELATCVALGIDDHQKILEFAQANAVGFVVIGPDDALVGGMVDDLEAGGIPCFGPTKISAQLEGSKAFAKDFMARNGIPTPAYRVFAKAEQALGYLENAPIPVVIKADGLALGKGVVIATTKEEARQAIQSMMVEHCFGQSGNTVVIEEFVTGPEVSLLALTDGRTILPMVSCMDHKRIFNDDVGPNTGGMGVVAPNPYLTEALLEEVQKTILEPTIKAMEKEGNPFKGCLFLGLMLTPKGPVVIEYNCRFGDPEAEAVLTLLDEDLLSILLSCRNGNLKQTPLVFRSESCCTVAVASKGYPQSSEKGRPITISKLPSAVQVMHAATKKTESGMLVTNGGRVLHVCGTGKTLEDAISKAYEGVACIKFEGMQFRTDIGSKALACKE